MKWKARNVVNPKPVQNPNPNPNPNIQMIYIEPRQPNLAVVTRGGAVIGADQNTLQGHPQVRHTAQKKAPLDVQQEKEVFLEA